ncbi:CPBP family intramembrane metalloprotease [Planctomicrobium sp.]|jgi:membrane protease YdiL (CAAX protease family)|nr:CPBP family intramembrane glutamic endopeptidase [Planctomicrobium sp.]MBT5019771.1 CPBP family intramembrane metalloprotease [Planctomicrobium sp.]MDB4733439.1 CPBP family intramembrane metalloprotease [Planctomicrobium sp.]
MDAPRLTIFRTLLPIAPFVVVIIGPNLVFLDASTHVENRPKIVTRRDAEGRTVTESTQREVTMVDLLWRLGPYAVSSSSTPIRTFLYQTHCSVPEEALAVSLIRARAWVAVCLFPIALMISIVVGRLSHWHSGMSVPSSRFYSPVQTVGTCLGILFVCVVGFASMNSLWPAGVSELVRWLRFSVTGIIPFMSLVIVAPIAEELVFRSGVCRLLVERIGPVAGIFLQALLFGSVHLATPLHMAVGFIGGIVLGSVYIYSRSLTASIFLHAGANFILAVACLTIA